LDACEIRIVETTAELDRGDLLPETPKSRAGRRTVTFPAELVSEPGRPSSARGSRMLARYMAVSTRSRPQGNSKHTGDGGHEKLP
jgi:hypothetical protein